MSNHNLRVGILRGGPSNEYDISLQTGKEILQAMRENLSDRYHIKDVFIDKQGIWHMDGEVVPPEKISSKIDLAFNALHGAYGEDGKVQHFLETHGIPFTGSGSISSAIGMNKLLTKKVCSSHGIPTARWEEVSAEDIQNNIDNVSRKIFRSWHLPFVIKPISSGSSVGVHVIYSYEDVPQALESALSHGSGVFIEEYIPGIEATCGVIDNFRGKELYSLPPVEIRSNNKFFDYEAKYSGLSEKIVPATFSQEIKKQIEDHAQILHKALGLRHYSRSDFIIHPRRGIYVLEVNTLPGLTQQSLMTRALHAVGSNLHEFADHIISLANRA